MPQSNVPIYASIGANVVIAATKLTAAAVTGSSAMIAEGVHSLVDASDGLLLLLGRKRSRRPPDEAHPFGHGREVYFWTLVVAIVFFAVGGGMSVYEGILHILHPEPMGDPTWNYVVLGIATAFDGTSWVIAVWHFRKRVGEGGWLDAMRRSKDPTTFSVVLEDSADLAGIAIAFVSIFLSHRLSIPEIDGVGSIGVGLVLATVAVFLAVQCKGLLVGEGASPRLLDRAREIVEADAAVTAVCRPLSMQLGPEDVLLGIEAEFDPDLSVRDVAAAIDRIRRRLRDELPQLRYVYLDPRRSGSAPGQRPGAGAHHHRVAPGHPGTPDRRA